jgi:hypothetical protein
MSFIGTATLSYIYIYIFVQMIFLDNIHPNLIVGIDALDKLQQM